MSRQDKRNIDTFKNDIKFGTLLEKYWFRKLLIQIINDPNVTSVDYDNNGVDNDGNFVDKSSRDADYRIKITTTTGEVIDKLLEIKFAPTKGKMTFKKHDLLSYIKQNANIYLIANNGEVSLKKPKDYDIDQHIKLIEENLHNIQYIILEPQEIQKIIDSFPETRIPYMGNKLGYIIKTEDLNKILKLNWSNYEF